jgi:type VI protein secretion system component VasK
MQFPLELRALRSPLSHFVDALCRPGFDSQPLRIRGFYLTSAMQVGRPVERVLSEMMRGFDIQRSPGGPAAAGEMNSYFLADLFRNVILSDVGLATRSAAGIERRSRRELRAGLIALAVAAFILFPASVSDLRNAQLAHEVDRTAQIAKVRAASVPGTVDDPIEAMLDTLDHLDNEASGFGIPGWFGPRAARELRGPLRKAYVERIHSVLRGRVAPELEKELSTLSKARRLDDSIDAPEDHTAFRNAYDTVKLYATLVDPDDHVDPSWTPDRLARAWQRTLPAGGTVDLTRLVRHAANYLDGLPENPSLKWPSTRALQDARVTLKQLGADQLPYRWLLRRASDQSPLLARDMLDAASQEYVTCPAEQELVPRQYTASAWAKIEPVLNSRGTWPVEARIERWAVADMGLPGDEPALRAQVRAEYYRDYGNKWMAVLEKCAVNRPADFKTSQRELEALKGPKGFYKSLFAQFGTNAIVEAKPDLLPIPLPLSTEGCAAKFASARPDAGAGATAKTPSPVQRSFEPLLVFSGEAEGAPKPAPLDNYIAHLENLRTALEGASDAPGGPDLAPQFANTKRGVERLLDGVQEPLKSKLRALLMPPVEGTIHVTKEETTKGTSDEWNKKVYAAWDTKLRAHRPFAGTDWAAFEDFRAFFQQDGTLWAFFKSTLAGSVELTDSGYKSKPGATPLAPDLLACLSVAQEITDAFFPATDDPGLRFSLQLDWSATDISDAKFVVGDKATVLPKAQWGAPLKWNGEGVRLEWVQAGRSTQEMGRHATFTLFDLFDQFHGLNPGGRHGIYEADFPPFAVRVRSDGKRDPLAKGFFARLHCPANIEMVTP